MKKQPRLYETTKRVNATIAAAEALNEMIEKDFPREKIVQQERVLAGLSLSTNKVLVNDMKAEFRERCDAMIASGKYDECHCNIFRAIRNIRGKFNKQKLVKWLDKMNNLPG